MEVTGPITVTLWAATSVTDTDFTAKLVDVCEDGCARNLTDGIMPRPLPGVDVQPAALEPGRAYCYTIDLWATSNVFKAGHQIRLEVSSSNFPRFDRNTNTGGVIASDDGPDQGRHPDHPARRGTPVARDPAHSAALGETSTSRRFVRPSDSPWSGSTGSPPTDWSSGRVAIHASPPVLRTELEGGWPPPDLMPAESMADPEAPPICCGLQRTTTIWLADAPRTMTRCSR